MKRILVTGGAGFVGSHLAINFKRHFQGVEVVVLDNLLRRGSELNLSRLAAHGIKFMHGDVRVPADLDSVGKCDFLIECSAEPSVLAGADGNPNYVIQTNLQGAINCAEYCRKYSCGLLFLSTSRVYSIDDLSKAKLLEKEDRFELAEQQEIQGLSAQGVSENFSTQGFKSFYGASKFCAENILLEYRQMFDWPIIINRCGLISGPWQFGKADQGIIPFWLQAHMTGRNLKYIGFNGLGKQVRDVIHINDLAELVMEQVKSPGKFADGVYNVGGGSQNSFSLKELTKHCEKLTGKKIIISPEPVQRYADIPVFVTDFAKISATNQFKIKFCVEDVLLDVYNWIQENKSVCNV